MRAALQVVLIGTLCALRPAHAAPFPSSVPPDNPKCTCRYKGEHLELGARRCLQTPDGPRVHECVTEQNVTSWRPRDEPCPQAWLAMPEAR